MSFNLNCLKTQMFNWIKFLLANAGHRFTSFPVFVEINRFCASLVYWHPIAADLAVNGPRLHFCCRLLQCAST